MLNSIINVIDYAIAISLAAALIQLVILRAGYNKSAVCQAAFYPVLANPVFELGLVLAQFAALYVLGLTVSTWVTAAAVPLLFTLKAWDVVTGRHAEVSFRQYGQYLGACWRSIRNRPEAGDEEILVQALFPHAK